MKWNNKRFRHVPDEYLQELARDSTTEQTIRYLRQNPHVVRASWEEMEIHDRQMEGEHSCQPTK